MIQVKNRFPERIELVPASAASFGSRSTISTGVSRSWTKARASSRVSRSDGLAWFAHHRP